MKFLIVAGCLSACVSAAPSFYGLVAHPNGAVVPAAYAAPAVAAYGAAPIATGYAGPLNLNTQLVAHPNGAVVPVDEPAVAAARADHHHAGGAPVYAPAHAVVAPAVHAYAGPAAYAAPAVHAAYAAPAVHAAYAAVPAVPAAGPAHYGLVAHPNGAVVPVDEPAVAL